MTLHEEMHELIGKHFRNKTTDVIGVLHVLTTHITRIIQYLPQPLDTKIAIAEEVLATITDEIIKDPNPLAKRMN